MDYKLAKSQTVVGYHAWSVGQLEKPTEKLNTMSSRTLFLGLAWWVETVWLAPSLPGVRSLGLGDLLFYLWRFAIVEACVSVALAEPEALSSAAVCRVLCRDAVISGFVRPPQTTTPQRDGIGAGLC